MVTEYTITIEIIDVKHPRLNGVGSLEDLPLKKATG